MTITFAFSHLEVYAFKKNVQVGELRQIYMLLL